MRDGVVGHYFSPGAHGVTRPTNQTLREQSEKRTKLKMTMQPPIYFVPEDRTFEISRPATAIRKYDVAPRQGVFHVRRKILRQLLDRLKSQISPNI